MYKAIIKLSLPLILSQGIQTLMVLTDRYFLSLKNPLFAAAVTTGGFTALSLSLFFIHLLLFSTSLIAKNYGRNQLSECEVIFYQCITIATFSIPLLALLNYVADLYFDFLGHPLEYRILEEKYFYILIFSQVFSLYRTCIEAFLIGIGRSGKILHASFFGVFINIPLTYAFILGPYSSYFNPVEGAAWSTVVSNVSSLFFLAISSSSVMNINFGHFSFTSLFRGKDLKILLMQGSFSGLEKFINSICFVSFVNMLVFYGNEVSIAISIVFTLDQIAFLPLLGIYASVMSIYSRFLGINNLREAQKSLAASLHLAYGLMFIFSVFFWVFAENLVQIMLKGDSQHLNKEVINEYAIFFLRTTCLYIFANTTIFLYKAALRSLGLSWWCFQISVCMHLLLILTCYYGIHYYHLDPSAIWGLFMAFLGGLAIIYVIKYHRIIKRSYTIDVKC